MTLDIRALIDRYVLEYPAYGDLVGVVKSIVKAELAKAQVDASPEGRPKDVDSLVKKAIRKHAEKPDEYADPLAAMPDKAGVRIIVDYLGDAGTVCRLLRNCFDVLAEEDMRHRYRPNELGYLGVHLQVRLLDQDISADRLHLRGLECEVQVHTRAQSAWARVSHPLLYKPAGGEPNQEIASRVMRAVALVSLFDEQVEEARCQVLSLRSFRPAQMLHEVTKLFVSWMRSEPDDQLSLTVLDVVQHAYDEEELQRFKELIGAFIAGKRAVLDMIYAAYSGTQPQIPLLFQPEALAIYERLVNRPHRLRASWANSRLGQDLLLDLGEVFGIAVTLD